MAAVWGAVLSDVASVLQITGVDVAMLLFLVDKLLLRLRYCKLECAKLKQRVSELQALQRLPTGRLAERVMMAQGLWVETHQAINGANSLVDSYSASSVFRVIGNSRRMERDMSEMRRRVDACYDLAVCIHAGVAVGAAATQAVPNVVDGRSRQ